MGVDRGRGLKRLAVALAVPWALWWSYRAWTTYTYIRNSEDLLVSMKAMGLETISTPAHIAELEAELWRQLLCLGAPFIVGALAYWVYRGFKPQK